MNSENQSTKEVKPTPPVDKKRRSFTKVGMTAPVIMTLANRPAFGAQCLSNILSGNLSDPNRGSCWGGNSPGGWGNPDGKIGSLDASWPTVDAWKMAGFSYSESCPNSNGNGNGNGNGNSNGNGNGNGNQSSTYCGGSYLSDLPDFLHGEFTEDLYTTPIRDILPNALGAGLYDNRGNLIACWLNVQLAKNTSLSYVLNEAQFISLYQTNRDDLINIIVGSFE